MGSPPVRALCGVETRQRKSLARFAFLRGAPVGRLFCPRGWRRTRGGGATCGVRASAQHCDADARNDSAWIIRGVRDDSFFRGRSIRGRDTATRILWGFCAGFRYRSALLSRGAQPMLVARSLQLHAPRKGCWRGGETGASRVLGHSKALWESPPNQKVADPAHGSTQRRVSSR